MGRAEHDVAQLVEDRDPLITSRAASDRDHPDRLDVAGPRLRQSGRRAGERGASSGDRVNSVGLAGPMTGLTVRAVNLDDIDALAGKVSSEAGPIPVPSTPTLTISPKPASQTRSGTTPNLRGHPDGDRGPRSSGAPTNTSSLPVSARPLSRLGGVVLIGPSMWRTRSGRGSPDRSHRLGPLVRAVFRVGRSSGGVSRS